MRLIDKIKKIVYRNKRTLLIVTVVSFVSAFIAFSFILVPAIRQFSLLSMQIKQKKRDMAKVQIPADNYKLSELNDKMEKAKNDLEAARDRLFWEKDISRFLNELTLLAAGLQIEFVSLKPETYIPLKEKVTVAKEAQEYLFTQVPISVILKGSYNDLLQFLKRIEDLNKFIKIDALRIESDRSDISRHNIKMMLSVFSQEKS